jgi:hypothetical protein
MTRGFTISVNRFSLTTLAEMIGNPSKVKTDASGVSGLVVQLFAITTSSIQNKTKRNR